MTGDRRTASVVAATEVECYRIDKDVFRSVMRTRPDMAELMSQVMAKRRIELETVREGLDAESRKRRVKEERSEILSSIQTFFGMDDDKA
jgi:CRP-like cAMP-binding protein